MFFIISHNDNLISHYANSGLIFGNKTLTWDITKLNLPYHKLMPIFYVTKSIM